MKKFTESLNEGKKEYTLISAVIGENPETCRASINDIKDSNWVLNFFFGGDTDYEQYAISIASYVQGDKFKRSGQVVIEGDDRYLIIIKDGYLADLYNMSK